MTTKQDCILITGGYGFIGSHLIEQMHHQEPGTMILNMDCLTYAGKRANLAALQVPERVINLEIDISDAIAVAKIFKRYPISGVIHLAAESHVDNSLHDPGLFVRTNVIGSHNLLHQAYTSWMNGPHDAKPGCEKNRYVQVSTDEVYGSLGPTEFFTETSPYAPNSPYSATKASADLIVRSYHQSYGLNTGITCCVNNYGPRQHHEKLIPHMISKALAGQPLPIYGDGQQVRDWLHVSDHCRAIELVYRQGAPGRTYNIGARSESTNLDLVIRICEILDQKKPDPRGRSYKELITFVKDRPGHDRRYATNADRMRTELGWQPLIDQHKGLEQTVQWYCAQILSSQL
ncbi:MAG: dTDP-glucose 4,6-dehydratase [Leptospiraceae bacterium]|nr:dTDP-glucose 4,6-dehydratase [Leptospiraceae bacterium]